jgi:hypothetical protein
VRFRIPFFFTALLLLAVSAFGQTRGFLKVAVIDGDGAFNDIRNKIGHAPAVEVRDESNEVVAGAEVLFTLPAFGPSGTFDSGQRSMKTTTDTRGIATADGFRPNPTEGRFTIAVAASYMGKQGSAMVGQSNTLATSGGNSHKKLWIILGVVGGAAAGGILATHSSSSSGSAAAATSITVGPVIVGGPR